MTNERPEESISVFDIFKIGVGPSSSHTLGPWRAAQYFLEKVLSNHDVNQIIKIQVLLYGSLAKTGVGHGTDIAVQLGLMGADPVTFNINSIQDTIESIRTHKKLSVNSQREIDFDPDADIIFLKTESLPFHPNALTFLLELSDGTSLAETYYSIGGGFVVQENSVDSTSPKYTLPFPVDRAEQLNNWCIKTGFSISELVMENESAIRTEEDTRAGIIKIWHTMRDCIYKGVHTSGILPGGLSVTRRAATINKQLLKDKTYSNFDEWLNCIRSGGNSFQYILDWVSCFALAVNEENAAFGRVVTAPTNGAAGVIPAVLMYYITFCSTYDEERIISFLCTASEIGSIFKKGATLSAAMGGCQAEIGVSSSMAAAALTECLGGTVKQCLMASEIAMEHHLGLTCDPVGGLVQVPCIERNTMGAIKAITASQLALKTNPYDAKVSLDAVVKTMWQTALDMNTKYKETSDGGLAINIPLGLSEC